MEVIPTNKLRFLEKELIKKGLYLKQLCSIWGIKIG